MRTINFVKNVLGFSVVNLAVGFVCWAGPTTSADTNPVGFSSGKVFTESVLNGTVFLQCNQGIHHNTQYYRCNRDTLFPVEYDYLVTSTGVDADNVALSAKNSRGNVVQKKEFAGERNSSKKQFNLWISTLLQKPLLERGENTVGYEFFKAGQSVQKGQFSVRVVRGSDKNCQSLDMYSNNMDDCTTGGYLVCERYFQQINYCR